jgi:AraC-like DNA-binding protein
MMGVLKGDSLAEARQMLETYCYRPLDMGEVAAEVGLSKFHFIRAFRAAYGVTPYQYLTRHRIERAKALLAYGELSVTDVCLAVGFQSLGSFSTLFRRYAGCSPSEYREQTQAQREVFYRSVPACFFNRLGFAQVLEKESNFREATPDSRG